MTLNTRIQVDLPKSGVIVRRSGKYPAVYKVLRSYRNDKGHPTSDRVNIGKLDVETGKLIPNARYWDYYETPSENMFPSASFKSTCSFGTAFLSEHVMDSLGITEILDECLGDNRSRLVQTTAIYMFARGNVLEGILDYCEDFAFM
jgi:hypothetical protein